MNCLFRDPDRLAFFATFLSLIASLLAFLAAIQILARIGEGEETEDEIIILKQKIKAMETHIQKMNIRMR